MFVARCLCPTCGRVEFPAEDLMLDVITQDEETAAERMVGRYGFLCPECGDTVWKDADSGTLKMLVTQRIEDLQQAAERILEQAAS